MRQHGTGQGWFARRPGVASRLFPERQIICRSDGRTTYVRLGSGFQFSVALLLVATAGWLAYASTMTMWRGSRSAAAVSISLPPPPTQADVKAELDRVRAALADLTAEKDRTSARRELLGREVDELEQRLASLLRTQQSLLDGLGSKRLPDLAKIERAIRAAGLDPAKLLSQGDGTGGMGGPLVPLPRARADALSSNPATAALIADMGQLERRYSRLAELQQVLDHLPLVQPTPDLVISSGFGARPDPFTGQPAFHEGIDIQGRGNDPVAATAAGVVAVAGPSGPYGNMVEIDHGMGLKTRYAHLRRIDVKPGDAVARGQIVGAMGSSGRSSGTHLHYEVRYGDEALDPTNFIEAGRNVFKLEQEAASRRP
jgi:murein DD-endopeptidase MepM/ murein hydrolase activator NlpD